MRSARNVVAEYLTGRMLSWDYMIRDQKENVLVFNKSTSVFVSDSIWSSDTVPGEFRVTYNLVNVSEGVRVMTAITVVKSPGSAFEQVVEDRRKATEDARSFQGLLNDMKYRLESPNPGTLGASVSTSDGRTIVEVEAGTAAAKAGLKVDDVIMSIDGVAMTDDVLGNLALGNKDAGTTHQLTIRRDGDTETVSVVYDKADVPGKSASASAAESKPGAAGTNAPAVGATTQIVIEGLGLTVANNIVVDIAAGGSAEQAGVRKADMITMIDGEPVAADVVENASRMAKGKTNTSVVLTLKRGDQEVTVAVIRKNPAHN